jgi:hypothetical protein
MRQLGHRGHQPFSGTFRPQVLRGQFPLLLLNYLLAGDDDSIIFHEFVNQLQIIVRQGEGSDGSAFSGRGKKTPVRNFAMKASEVVPPGIAKALTSAMPAMADYCYISNS